MKQLYSDLKDMDNGNFKKKYGKDKPTMGKNLNYPEKITENFGELTNLKKQISLMQRKHDGMQGMSLEKKKLAIRLQNAKDRHKKLFMAQFGKLTEAKEPSEAFRRAQKNLAGLKTGEVQRKHALAVKAQKDRSSMKKSMISMHKDDADHHRKMYNKYHAEYKEHDETYHDIEKNPGNWGFRKDAHHGALDEIGSMRDRAAEKRYHHETKFNKSRNEYEETSGKKYKHELDEETINELRLDPKDREDGTASSVANYKEDTPGEKKKTKKHSNCGTPNCCGECKTMKEGTIEGVPVVHTNSADFKNVKVTTPTGKVVWRKQRKTRDLIK
jgi:hypothetical protein